MLVSYNLLKKYVDLPESVTPAEVAEKLTMSTVEVEKVIELARDLENVVVGKVIKLEAHPNADKLRLADVDIGEKEPVRVVCGGINLKPKMLVAFAKIGAMVRWHGQGEPVKLAKAKIRGVESNGMICSANEIGLFEMFPHREMEIMDLTQLNLSMGQPLAKALNLSGVIFDIDNKSLTNRPDLWGHYGIAREIAAIYNVPLKDIELYSKSEIRNPKSETNSKLKIQNSKLDIELKDKHLCPRYLACVVENVKVAESPTWLKNELAAIGHNTFNNIVDITNYVLEEVGQPLHAFDKKLVDKLVIRRAKKGEKIVSLDNQIRELDEEMLVIADSQKPIALAGIMGGFESGVTQKTNSIVLEAANFDAVSVRTSSQKLGLRTDSSIRFEKALSPALAETGMRRALQLIGQICPRAKISQVIVEAGDWNFKPTKVKVSLDFIQRRIGKKIPERDMLSILGRLGFKFSAESGILTIDIPSWRDSGDISIAEDIVEEVARIYGYDNLEEKQEKVALGLAKYQKEFDLENRVKNYLAVGCGMSEVFNYAWADEKLMDKLSIKSELEIANPPTDETKYLQTSLMPNLIKNIEDNLRFFDEFKIFELARIFTKDFDKWNNRAQDKLPHQPKYLAGAVVTDKKGQPFLEIKGIIENFKFQILNFKFNFKLVKPTFAFIDDKRILEIMLDGEEIGWLGEIDYGKLNFRNKKVALFEIDFEKLIGLSGDENIKYVSLPEFPLIERDIAVEVDWGVKWADIKAELEKIDKLIDRVEFLSEYGLPDKKSLAFRVIYGADRTLKDSEVAKIEKKILNKLKSKFGAELRK